MAWEERGPCGALVLAALLLALAAVYADHSSDIAFEETCKSVFLSPIHYSCLDPATRGPPPNGSALSGALYSLPTRTLLGALFQFCSPFALTRPNQFLLPPTTVGSVIVNGAGVLDVAFAGFLQRISNNFTRPVSLDALEDELLAFAGRWRAGAAGGGVMYDVYQMPYSAVQDLRSAGALAGLGGLSSLDTHFLRRDVHPAILDLVTTADDMVAVPLDGSQLVLFARTDVLAALGLGGRPPESWEQLLEVAARANATEATMLVRSVNASGGISYNRTTGPLYGFCMQPSSHSLEELALAVLAPVVQTRGSRSGMYLDINTLRPAAATPAMSYVLSYVRRLAAFAAPVRFSAAAPPFSDDFALGRCAMALGSAAQFRRNSHAAHPAGPSAVRGGVAASLLPGSELVLGSGPAGEGLVRCTPELCPYAALVSPLPGTGAAPPAVSQLRRLQQGAQPQPQARQAAAGPLLANRAPLLSPSGLVGGIAPSAEVMAQLYSWLLLSSIGGPTNSWGLLLHPSSEVGPWRMDHFAAGPGRWAAAGYDAADAASFLAAARASLDHPNVVWPLRIRGAVAHNRAVRSAAWSLLNATAAGQQHDTTALDAAQASIATGLTAAVLALYGGGRYGSTIDGGSAAASFDGAQSNLYVDYRRSFGYKVAVVEPAPAPAPQSSEGPPVGVIVGSVVGGTVVLLLAALLAHRTLRRGGQRSLRSSQRWRVVAPPGASPETVLLVTDIEGSTTLWESLPEAAMDAALRTHHATVRTVGVLWGAYESATEGDSFVLAFSSAPAAAQFALGLQRALLAASWPRELLAVPACAPVYIRRQEAVARAAGVSLAVPPAPRLLGAVPRAAAALTRAPRIHRGNGAASAASAAARHRLHGRQGVVLGSLIPGAKAAGRRDEAVAALMEAAAAVAAAAAEAAADAEADAELDADVAAGPDAMALPVRPEIRCELSEMPAPVSGDQVTTPSKRRWLPRGFLGSMGPGPGPGAGPGAGLGPDSGRGLAAAAMSPSSIRRRSETALLGAASLFARPSPSYQAREPVERRCQGRSSDGGGPAGAAASARGAGNAPPARRMGRRASLLDGVAAAAAAAVATAGWGQRGGLSRHLATVDAAPGDQVWDAAHPGAPPLPLGASPAQIYRQDSYSQGLASPEGPHSDQNAVTSRRHARGSAATLTTVAVTSVAAATGAAAFTSGTVPAPGTSSPNSNPGRLRRASQVLTNWLGLGSTGSPGPPVALHSPEAYTTRTPNDTASGTFGSNASERRRQSRLLGVGRLSIGFGAGSAGAGATQPGGSHGAGVVGGGGTGGGGLRHSTLVAWLSGAGGADNEDQAQRPSPVRGRAAQFLAQLQGAANDSHPTAAAYAPAGGSSRGRPAARRLPMRRASALGPPGSALAAPAAAAAAGVQRGAGSFSLIRAAQAARVGRRFSAVTERLALPSHLGAGAHLQPVSALHMAGGPGPAAPSGEIAIVSQVMGSPVEGVPCPWGSELVPTDTAWQGSGRRRRAGQEDGGEGAGGSLGQAGSRAANEMSAIVAAAAVAAQAKMRPSDLARVFSFGPSQHVLAGYGTGSSHGSPATQTGPPTGGGDGPASHVLSAAIASPGYNLASPGKLQERERRARSAFDNQGIRADTGGANGGADGSGAVRLLLSHAANTVSGSMQVESRQPSPPPRHGTPSTAPQLMGSDGQANPLAGPSGQLRLSDSPGLASLRGRSGQAEDAFADSPRVSTELAGGISPLPPSHALQPPLLRQLRQQQEQRLSQEQRRSQDPWRVQEAGAKRPESAAQASEDLPPQFASPESHWQWQQQQEKLHPHPQQQPRAGSHTRFSATLPPPLQIPSQQQGPPQPPRLAEPGRSLLRTQSAYAQEPQVRSLLGRGVSAGEQLELATSQNATHLTSTTSPQPQLNDSFSGNLPAAAATATSAGQAPVGYPSIASTAGPPALASPHTSWRAHPPTVAALRALAAGPGGPPLSPAQASVAGSYAGSEAGHGAGVTMTSPMPRFVSSPTPSHAQEPTSSSAIALHRRFAELAQETMPYASVPVPASPGQEPSLLRRLPLRRGSGLSGASDAGHSSASGAGAAAAGGGSGPGAPNASFLALAGGPVQGAIRSGGSGVAAVVSSALRFRSFTRPLSRAAPSAAAAGHRAVAGGSVSGAGAGFGAGGGGVTLTGGGGTGGIQTGPSSGTRSRMVVRTVNSRRALMEPLAEEATTGAKVESPESASPTLTNTTGQAPSRARNIRRSRTFTAGPDRTAQGPPARPSTPHATGGGGGDTEAGDSRYSQASGGAYGTGTASMYGGTGAGGGTGGGLGSVSISGLLPTALAAIRDAFSGVSSGRRALAGFAGGESSLRGEGSALARGQSGLDSNASVVLDPSRRGAATPPLLSSAVEVGSLLEIQPDPGSEAGARDTHAVPLPLQPPPPLMSYARLSYPTSPLPDDRPSPLTGASPADAMMSGAAMSGGGAGVTALDAATLAVFPYPLPQLSAPEVSMALAPPPQPRPSAVAMGHTAHRRPPMPGSFLELLHRVFLPVPDFPDPPPPDCVLVFAGLRVRVGLHSGVQAKDITYNPATARVTYSGDSLRTAKCVCDCASGGQVIMSGEVLLRLQLAMPGGGGVLMLQLQAHIMDLGDHQLLDSVPLHLAAPPPPLPPPTYGPAASLPTGPSKVAEPVPAIAVPVSRHLLQLAPPGLLGRLSFMPPVRSAIHQYTPGFMDAPVGDSVAVVVFRVSHASALLAWNAAVAAESMALLELYLRASLGPLLPTAAAAGPHDVRPHTAPGASTAPSNDGAVTSPGAVDAGAPSGTPCYLAAAPPGSPFGTFVAGFNETAAAARWALQAAARMADLPWPEQLLETPWGRPLEEVSQAEAEAADAAPTGGPTAGFVGALLARGMGAVGGGGSEISTRQHGGSASGAASPQLRPGNGRLGLSSPVRTSPFLRLKRTVTAHVAPSSAGLPLKLPAPPTSSGQSFTGSLWTAGPSLELKPQSDPHLLGSGSAPGPGATGLVHAGGGAPDEPGATSGSGPYGGRISCGEPRGSNGPLAVGSGSGSVMRGMFTGQRGDSRSPMQRSPQGVRPRTGSSAEPLSLPSRLASPPPPSLAASLRAIAPVAATLEESDRVSYSLAFMPMSVRQSVDPASMSFALDRHEMCLASGTHSLDPVGTFLQDSQTGLPRSGSVQITSAGPPARSARLVPHLNIHARSTSHNDTGHTTPSPSPAALRHTAATDSDTLPDALGCARSTANATAVLTSLATVNAAALDHTSEQEAEQSPGETASPARDGPGRLSAGSRAIRPGSAALPYSSSGRMAEPSSRNASGPHRRLKARLRQLTLSFTSLAQRRGGGGGSGSPLALKASDRAMSTHTASSLSVGRAASGPRLGPSHLRSSAGDTRGGGVPSGLRTGPSLLGPPPGRTSGSGTTGPGMLMGTQQTIELKEDGELLTLRGLRVRLGLAVGAVRVELCPMTGRVVYSGKTVTAAMTAAAAARLGALYATQAAAEAIVCSQGGQGMASTHPHQQATPSSRPDQLHSNGAATADGGEGRTSGGSQKARPASGVSQRRGRLAGLARALGEDGGFRRGGRASAQTASQLVLSEGGDRTPKQASLSGTPRHRSSYNGAGSGALPRIQDEPSHRGSDPGAATLIVGSADGTAPGPASAAFLRVGGGALASGVGRGMASRRGGMGSGLGYGPVGTGRPSDPGVGSAASGMGLGGVAPFLGATVAFDRASPLLEEPPPAEVQQQQQPTQTHDKSQPEGVTAGDAADESAQGSQLPPPTMLLCSRAAGPVAAFNAGAGISLPLTNPKAPYVVRLVPAPTLPSPPPAQPSAAAHG